MDFLRSILMNTPKSFAPIFGSTQSKVNMRYHRRGFTLIELLTVIAIIGILAAIIIPTVGAVRRSAHKASCASNLHQLGVAINLFRNDNRGLMPDGQNGVGRGGAAGANNSDLQRLGSDFIDTFIGKASDNKAGYGMTWEMFFCKGNQAYYDRWVNEPRPAGSTNTVIGYLYFPGTTLNVQTTKGTATSIYQRLTDPLGYTLVAADINRKFGGNWGGGIAHTTDPIPVGGNHLYFDGSVKWASASDFPTSPALSSSGSDYFFKTEDIR